METEFIENNPILKLTIDFSVMVIEYCDLLLQRKRFVLANQLTASGTSIGANVMEAQDAESKSDFIHKMKVAAKEALETQYWLCLCSRSKQFPDCSELVAKLVEVQKVLNKIIGTSKQRYQGDRAK